MTKAVLTQEHTATTPPALFISFELAQRRWKVTCGDGRSNFSRFDIEAGDTQAVLDCIGKCRQRFALAPADPVFTCYEAGRDGWWLHRWLLSQDICNIVVDSASIEVNRRSRRAKSDRLDGNKLLQMLIRHVRGGERVWSVVRCPTVEQEDARRSDRELHRLKKEQTGHANRLRGLLMLHNLRPKHVGGRTWVRWWKEHQNEVPPALRAEIERENERLALAHQQILRIESLHGQAIENEPKQHPVAAQLMRLSAVGPSTAWRFDKQFFGWRHFDNRRQVAACLGLTPTPYDSGDSNVEQGISRAGDPRLRASLIELSWSWLRFQPDSDISQWYQRRFAHAGKRMRRIGIVAVARRLLVALWRYVERGELPKGAVLKHAA